MLWFCIWVLNFLGFSLDLLGQPVMVHFCTPKSIQANLQNLSILFSCVWSVWRLFVIAARSFAYAAELIVNFDVPNVYPFNLCATLWIMVQGILEIGMDLECHLEWCFSEWILVLFCRSVRRWILWWCVRICCQWVLLHLMGILGLSL